METPRHETDDERAARVKAEFLAFKKPQTHGEDFARREREAREREHKALQDAAQTATGQAVTLTEVE